MIHLKFSIASPSSCCSVGIPEQLELKSKYSKPDGWACSNVGGVVTDCEGECVGVGVVVLDGDT